MPDAAGGFLHNIFDTLVNLLLFVSCLCVLLYLELEVIAEDCFKMGSQGNLKQTLDYTYVL